MAMIIANKNVLKRLAGKDLTDAELEKNLASFGAKAESTEGDEWELEIEANRPDMLSAEGVGRQLRTYIRASKGLQRLQTKSSGWEVIVDKSVEGCRPYTACAVVKGITFTENVINEIIQLQEKLHATYGRNRKRCAIGIYPAEAIKPPIHFKGLKPEEIKFRPLGADRKMNAQQILRTHPKGKEYAKLMDGLERYACFIDSNNKIMSMTPIINSEDTGKVDENTKEVFVECSGFDFNVVSKCLNFIVYALADMGGTVEMVKVKYPDMTRTTPDLKADRIKIDYKYINRVLGTELSQKMIDSLLERMGFGVENNEALIPPYRVDVLHNIDLAEDVAIAYGYDKFKGELVESFTIGCESKEESLKTKIREILIGLGLIEVRNYHLANKDVQKELLKMPGIVLLKNSKSKEYNSMRGSLLVSLLNTLVLNMHREYPQKIFELGKVFSQDKNEETGVREDEKIAVMLSAENADYTKARQILDALLRDLGIEAMFEDAENPLFFKGRCASVKVKNKIIGYVGEISPEVLTYLGLQVPASGFEINLIK